jgi:hypothetical protein
MNKGISNMNALQVALVKAERDSFIKIINNASRLYKSSEEADTYIAKTYEYANNRMNSALLTKADKLYQGQGYIPWYILNQIVYKLSIVECDTRSIAVFDKITYSLLKNMLKCINVVLFDKGEGFLESNMKFDIIIGNPPYSNDLHMEFFNSAV